MTKPAAIIARIRSALVELEAVLSVEQPPQTSVEAILDAVKRSFRVGDEMFTKSKTQDVADARFAAMLILAEQDGLKDKHIAKIFNRERSTVVKAREVALSRLQNDRHFTRKYTQALAELEKL